MAGHSKWANIKHHKAKQDAKRGKLYTKLIREITVSAKLGGGDENSNPRLRTALDKALDANMSRDVIDRAIKRGVGGMEGEQVEEVRYEGYGPSGVAIIVDCMTNNRNRTVADVRHAFTKCGGNLGTDGSVAYLFNKIGQMTFAPGADEERILELALETGAEDVIINDDKSIDVTIKPDAFPLVKKAMLAAGLHPAQAEVTMAATLRVAIIEKEPAEKLVRLIDMLEDLDDVQEVYTNADIVEEEALG
ncbi:MAG: putative transcriptional regulatory protein [Gammaproteobacteria bacterium]|jgi:YebC/PmpR family DNA-binding regulatory protein|nr:putative transcriptional regulatory protein [Gammaproteobacteria bacterium]MCE3237154.1 putative transcriptional regulatory protein [Gammaproteobacteria bacterium]